MISDRRMGPCIVSLWTHPDVGTGTFFVVVNPAPGMTIPKDLRFDIGIRPVTGRLAEKLYSTTLGSDRGKIHYYARVPLDRQELWRVNLYLRSTAWSGSVTGDVEATPSAFAPWDFVFFALPFVAVGFLWLAAVRRKYLRRADQ